MYFPRQVYAIYPYNEQGEVAGVYIGSSQNVRERFGNHLSSKHTQDELHRLMNEFGYTFQVLDTEHNYDETQLEYDWIDFFIKSKAKVFNKYTRDGNQENVQTKFIKPFWNGKGVVWKMKPKGMD